MKKILLIIIILTLCIGFAFAEKQGSKFNPNQKPPQMRHQTGMGQGRSVMRFGMSREDFDNLNLSKAQKEKAGKIAKKYTPQYASGLKFDRNKFFENQNKARSEFRAMLNANQKKTYDKGIEKQKKQNKELISKIYKVTAKELKFSDKQNKKLSELINKYDDNFMEFNNKFESLMTANQKKKYKELRENRFKNRPQRGTRPGSIKPGMRPGGPGMPPQGKHTKPYGPVPQHKNK